MFVGRILLMFRTTSCCAALVWACSSVSAKPRLRPAKATECSSARQAPQYHAVHARAGSQHARASRGQRQQPAATAKAQRAPHRAIAARKKPSRLPVPQRRILRIAAGARTPNRQQWAPTIQSLSTAPPMRPRPKRWARPMATGPDVQLVDAEDFNDIDRKADSDPPPCRAIRRRSTAARRTASKPAFPGCGGSGLRWEAPSPRWQRRCTNSSRVIV